MNFDVRSYCERIASAAPDRFQWHGSGPVWSGGASWWLKPMTGNPRVTLSSDVHNADSMWEFIGPLADELGVRWFDLMDSLGKAEYPGASNTMLEATFSAVCKKLEAAKEEAV